MGKHGTVAASSRLTRLRVLKPDWDRSEYRIPDGFITVDPIEGTETEARTLINQFWTVASSRLTRLRVLKLARPLGPPGARGCFITVDPIEGTETPAAWPGT